MEFLLEIVSFDFDKVISAALASSVLVTATTQFLKIKWLALPAARYPRLTAGAVSIGVAVASSLMAMGPVATPAEFVIYLIVSFIVSGLIYDGISNLIKEQRELLDDETI